MSRPKWMDEKRTVEFSGEELSMLKACMKASLEEENKPKEYSIRKILKEKVQLNRAKNINDIPDEAEDTFSSRELTKCWLELYKKLTYLLDGPDGVCKIKKED